jgi:hypothetical protein
MSTRLTWSLKVATDWSSTGWAGALLTGGASGEGASWARAVPDSAGKPIINAAIPNQVRILVL